MATPTLAERRQQQADHEGERQAHLNQRGRLLSPRRDKSQLKSIVDDNAGRLANATTDEVLAWVAEEFGYRTTVACSMADAVLPHVVAEHLPWVDTLFLDTGYHFAETLGTRDAVESTMRVSIVDVKPALTVDEQNAKYGDKLYSRDPGLCCHMRKVEPLSAILREYEVWITGVRRDEAPTRANTPLVSWDEKNGLVKVNPLAAWSSDDLFRYADLHNVIVNPLLDDGFPSIGCSPCTRRVAPGEDPRSGRWAGMNKTECGLHT